MASAVLVYAMIIVSAILASIVNPIVFDENSRPAHWAFMMFPTLSISRGLHLIAQSTEDGGAGYTSSELFSTEIGVVYLWLLIEAICFPFLGIYLDNVVPHSVRHFFGWPFCLLPFACLERDVARLLVIAFRSHIFLWFRLLS